MDELGDRILAAAAELLARHGYAKTTVDDVARAASVARGTIYLRWKGREALFAAVLVREKHLLMHDVAAELEPLPAIDLRALLTALTRAYRHRPLLIAVLTRDADVVGTLVRSRAAAEASDNGLGAHLVELRTAGLIDTTRSLAEQVTVLSAVFIGWFVSTPMLPADFIAPDGPELVAETIHRMLMRAETLTAAELAATDTAVRSYLRRSA